MRHHVAETKHPRAGGQPEHFTKTWNIRSGGADFVAAGRDQVALPLAGGFFTGSIAVFMKNPGQPADIAAVAAQLITGIA